MNLGYNECHPEGRPGLWELERAMDRKAGNPDRRTLIPNSSASMLAQDLLQLGFLD